MNATVLIYAVFAGIYAFTAYVMFQLVLACWRPARANADYVAIVQNRNARFFKFFKVAGPILMVVTSFGVIGLIARIALVLSGAVAG